MEPQQDYSKFFDTLEPAAKKDLETLFLPSTDIEVSPEFGFKFECKSPQVDENDDRLSDITEHVQDVVNQYKNFTEKIRQTELADQENPENTKAKTRVKKNTEVVIELTPGVNETNSPPSGSWGLFYYEGK